MNYNFVLGEILLFNKPLYWTSFDLVNKVRKILTVSLNTKLKVGHAGTLDPLATGLVIICTGKKTKEIDSFQDLEKEYITTIQLGATTPSYDLETEINETFPTDHLNEELINQVLTTFVGEQEQIAPTFSAKKVDGKRAYLKARQGIDVEIKPSKINIREIEFLSFRNNQLEIKIVCSKGTYIRALARDLGQRLNTGGHLIKLHRSKIGTFNSEKSISLKDFEFIINENNTIK